MHQRTKHIEIDVYFVREMVAKQLLHMQFVSSNQQFDDILTKVFHPYCFILTAAISSLDLPLLSLREDDNNMESMDKVVKL